MSKKGVASSESTSTAERKMGDSFYSSAGSGQRFSSVGPAEGFGHGCVEVGDELLDLGAQVFLGGEVAAANELSHQDGEPDFDLVEP